MVARIARMGAPIAVGVTAFAFLGAAPSVDFGYYLYATTPLVFLLAGAGIAAALLAAGLDRRCGETISTPLPVLLIAAVAGLTLALSVFQPFTAFSITGAAGLGQGGAWWCAAAVMAIGAAWCAGRPVWRKPLLTMVAGALALDVVLYLGSVYGLTFGPYFFPEGSGYSLIGLAILALASAREARTRLILALLFALLAFVISQITNNRGLTLYALSAVVLFLSLRLFRDWRVTFAAFALGLIAASVFVATDLAQDLLRDQFGRGDAVASVLHRIEFWGQIRADVTASAADFLAGFGWGRVQDAIQGNLFADASTRLFEGAAWSPNTVDDLRRPSIHSHNLFYETAHAIGVPGALLVLAVFLALARAAVAHDRALAAALLALPVYSSLWYFVPGNVGAFFAAFGLAATLIGGGGVAAPRRAVRAVLSLFAVICLGGAAYHAMMSQRVTTVFRDFDNGRSALESFDRIARIDGSGAYVQIAMADAIGYAVSDEHGFAEPEAEWANVAALWPLVRERIRARPVTDHLQLSELAWRAALVTAENRPKAVPDSLKAFLREGWVDDTLAATARSPSRVDLLIHPLADLFERGDVTALRAAARKVLAQHPDNPAGLWFLGVAELQTAADPGPGFALMARALDRGISRFFPVDPALEAQIRGQTGG